MYLKFKLVKLQVLLFVLVFSGISLLQSLQQSTCDRRTNGRDYSKSFNPIDNKVVIDELGPFRMLLDKLGNSDPSKSLSVTDRNYVIKELTDCFITLNQIEVDVNLQPCIKPSAFSFTKFNVVTFLVIALFEECKEKNIMQASDVNEINDFLEALKNKIQDPNISLTEKADALNSDDMNKIIHSLRQCGVDTNVFGEEEEVEEEGEDEEEQPQPKREPSPKKPTKKVNRGVERRNW